jgi:hypothetical protein
VLAGRRLYSSRDELTALVAADSDHAAKLLPLINRAGAPDRRRAVRAALNVARRLARGAALSDTELAAVGASLTDREVRDTLFTAAASNMTFAMAARRPGCQATGHFDAAMVWPQQGRILEAWATRLREAREEFTDEPPLQALVEAAAADYLDAIADPCPWAD